MEALERKIFLYTKICGALEATQSTNNIFAESIKTLLHWGKCILKVTS